MVYSLAYRRPSYVDDPRDSFASDKQKSINESVESGSSCISHGIPPALSFDTIVAGGTCPPVTIRDFMNYLKYIEHSAENLQFYLWLRDYTARWESLPQSEKSLATEWTQAHVDAEANTTAVQRPQKTPPQISAILENSDFATGISKAGLDKTNPFNTPTKSRSFEDRPDFQSEYGSSMSDHPTNISSSTHVTAAEQAFEDAGMKWQPFSAQPYRDEITRIISVYLAEDSPRELNISGRERQSVLHALQHTTHPSALRTVATSVEFSLRKQAHPNFIRWTICNGNPPRVIFAHGLGIFCVVAAFIADLLLTLSRAGRAWRVLPFVGWFLGIATLVAATKGMCVVLHGLHHRHLRPWELFADSEAAPEAAEKKGVASSASNFSLACYSDESLTSSGLSNSFEDEPWIPRYKKRNYVRKIFDREIWIREPALRQIQDTIFLQSILIATLASAVAVGIFCAVPHGNFF